MEADGESLDSILWKQQVVTMRNIVLAVQKFVCLLEDRAAEISGAPVAATGTTEDRDIVHGRDLTDLSGPITDADALNAALTPQLHCCVSVDAGPYQSVLTGGNKLQTEYYGTSVASAYFVCAHLNNAMANKSHYVTRKLKCEAVVSQHVLETALPHFPELFSVSSNFSNWNVVPLREVLPSLKADVRLRVRDSANHTRILHLFNIRLGEDPTGRKGIMQS